MYSAGQDTQGGRPPLTGAQAYSLRILVCSLPGDVPKTAVYVKAVSCRPGHARDDDDDDDVCARAHARCTAQAETEVASLTKRVRALEEDFESTETRLVQTQVKLEQASKAADDSERSAHLSILFIHRVPVTSTGPDLRGAQGLLPNRSYFISR